MTDRGAVFDGLYAGGSDPWALETSAYEASKRAATLAALPRARYPAAFEVGCGPGLLTEGLAERCDRLLSLDVSRVAAGRAADRMASAPQVEVRVGEVPRDWPAGAFDLIVMAEILYFLTPDEVDRTAAMAHASLRPDGHCLLVNWTGPNDLPLDGDSAAARFRAAAPWAAIHERQAEGYRLDLLSPRRGEFAGDP